MTTIAPNQFTDLIMAVPSLVLAILVVAVLGPSLTNTIVAVTIVYLPRYVPPQFKDLNGLAARSGRCASVARSRARRSIDDP